MQISKKEVKQLVKEELRRIKMKEGNDSFPIDTGKNRMQSRIKSIIQHNPNAEQSLPEKWNDVVTLEGMDYIYFAPKNSGLKKEMLLNLIKIMQCIKQFESLKISKLLKNSFNRTICISSKKGFI